MDKIKNAFSHTIDVLEQDNRGVQLGCYSVALVGLSIAIRRVRPFSKFRKPSDIPNRFIQERKELTGVVEGIDPNGGLLMVRHKPLLAIPGLPDGQLPVKISGVNVYGFSLNWLQSIVVGNEIKFIPIVKDKNFVQCQVWLPQIQKNKVKVLNVGESLVKIGFGELADIERPITDDHRYLSYHRALQKAEHYAMRKKMGFKYYIEPTLAGLDAFLRNLASFVYGLYKQIIQIPRMPAS